MDKDLILSEEKGERKLMVHDSRFMVKGHIRLRVQGHIRFMVRDLKIE